METRQGRRQGRKGYRDIGGGNRDRVWVGMSVYLPVTVRESLLGQVAADDVPAAEITHTHIRTYTQASIHTYMAYIHTHTH